MTQFDRPSLILGFKEALQARNEDACREALRYLRPTMERPEKDMKKIFNLLPPEDVEWLRQTILNKQED